MKSLNYTAVTREEADAIVATLVEHTPESLRSLFASAVWPINGKFLVSYWKQFAR